MSKPSDPVVPSGPIVWIVEEGDHKFEIEELLNPVFKGAGDRTHRLWENGRPCVGSQWHYCLESAKEDIKRLSLRSHIDKIRYLEERVRSLEAQLMRTNQLIEDQPLRLGEHVFRTELKEYGRLFKDATASVNESGWVEQQAAIRHQSIKIIRMINAYVENHEHNSRS